MRSPAFHAPVCPSRRLSLAIVGDVERGRGARRGVRRAGRLAKHGRARAVRASGAGRRRLGVSARLRCRASSQSDIAYGFTTISRLDPRYYAYWMMNNILGQFGLGGRLADNIRERQGMAYYAYSTFDASVGRRARSSSGPASIRTTSSAPIAAIDAEVRATRRRRADAKPRSAETRQFLVGSIPRMLETNHSIAAFLQTCELFGLGLDYDRRLPALLQAVTLDEIRAAAADVLRSDRAAVSIAGPEPPVEAQP